MQRVAANLVQALDRQLASRAVATVGVTLLHPSGVRVPELQVIRAKAVGPAGLPLHLWEQFVLPLAARKGRLINLAGAACWRHRRQTCLLHDAAVFDEPSAYRPLFVAWYHHLFRRLARSGADLMTVSAFSRNRLALHLGVDSSTITVVRPGADHFAQVRDEEGESVLARLGLKQANFYLAVGSQNPTKNLPRLLRAWRALPPDRPPLVLVGGANRQVFGEVRLDSVEGLQLVGELSDSELRVLYLNATALVFPSLYEGCGLPPLEAMSLGCPVIASTAASLPEVCGQAALLVDPLDEAELSSAMARLASDANQREILREVGLRHSASRRWEDTGDEFFEHLRELGHRS